MKREKNWVKNKCHFMCTIPIIFTQMKFEIDLIWVFRMVHKFSELIFSNVSLHIFDFNYTLYRFEIKCDKNFSFFSFYFALFFFQFPNWIESMTVFQAISMTNETWKKKSAHMNIVKNATTHTIDFIEHSSLFFFSSLTDTSIDVWGDLLQ